MKNVYSYDECSIFLATQPKKVVTRKGEKAEIPSEKNFQKRFNILAAINGEGRVLYKILDRKQSKFEVIKFLKMLKRKNNGDRAVVTMDNFNTHRNQEVYECATQNHLFLHFQPTHSPFTNAVEELWRQLRIWLSHRLFETQERLKYAIHSFFRQNRFVGIDIFRYLC
jgi:transposase